MSNTPNDITRILYVAASPKHPAGHPDQALDPLSTEQEFKALQKALRHVAGVEIHPLFCATATDLHDALIRDDYQIVHLVAHGSEDGAELEDDGSDWAGLLGSEIFENLLRGHRSLRCVVLNACYSASWFTRTLGPAVVVMNGPVGDDAALAFSEGFYAAIGAGRSLPEAFDAGKQRVPIRTRDQPFDPAFLPAFVPDVNSPTDLPHVILRLHIGESNHQRISDAEIRGLVDEPDPICLPLALPFDRQTVTPRQWRTITRRLDQLLADARAVASGPVRYVIAGRAPLPVFAYLGASMVRMNPVFIANDFGGEGWKLYGPPETSHDNGRDPFTVAPPQHLRAPAGRFALSVQCSHEYMSPNHSIAKILEAEGATLLGTYAIHNSTNSHRAAPLTTAELPVLLGHVERGIKWIGEQAPNSDSLVVPLAGPNWMAFWIGHRLNPTVCGRFDLPNFVPGRGYVRALSFPMTKAPWLAGRPRVLLMIADPVDQMSGTQAGRSFDTMQTALERELGDEDAFEFRCRGAARIDEFMRDVEKFRPDILHLHLHGSEEGDLAFEDERGKTDRFELERFVAMLRATGVRPALIVLNACYSATIAPRLTAEIAECVVAMKDAVGVEDALKFSRFLYEALGRGNNLATAIEQGKAGAQLQIVEVKTRGDLAPSDIILMPRPSKHFS